MQRKCIQIKIVSDLTCNVHGKSTSGVPPLFCAICRRRKLHNSAPTHERSPLSQELRERYYRRTVEGPREFAYQISSWLTSRILPSYLRGRPSGYSGAAFYRPPSPEAILINANGNAEGQMGSSCFSLPPGASVFWSRQGSRCS